MDVFVAPTVINLSSPTFWISSDDGYDPVRERGVLLKIMETNNVRMDFDITKKDFASISTPLIRIEIILGKVTGSFQCNTFKYFISVL